MGGAIMRLNLHHLHLFHAIAQDGTLTGAAARLNISQSAVSTQLRALEASLGHDLFERRGRGLILTEAGRIALDHADTIFRTASDLTAILGEAGRARSRVRVGALATLSRNFQMQFLKPLLNTPDLEVSVQSGVQDDLLRGLEDLSLDVVLTNLAPARDAQTPWLIHAIDEQPVSLIAAPARIAARITGRGDDLGALLRDMPLILPSPQTAIRAGFDALAARLGVTPIIAAEADDMAMLRLLVREDAGLGVIPPIVARDELASGRLVEVKRLEGITESFFAVTRARRFPNPHLAELLKVARAT